MFRGANALECEYTLRKYAARGVGGVLGYFVEIDENCIRWRIGLRGLRIGVYVSGRTSLADLKGG